MTRALTRFRRAAPMPGWGRATTRRRLKFAPAVSVIGVPTPAWRISPRVGVIPSQSKTSAIADAWFPPSMVSLARFLPGASRPGALYILP